MSNINIPTTIADAIKHIAPEIEMDEIDLDEDLREECDLDSMDFLNLLASLKRVPALVSRKETTPKYAVTTN